MVYAVRQLEVIAAEDGYGIEEVLEVKTIERDNKPATFATPGNARRFIERQTGHKLEDIGEGYYRIDGEIYTDGQQMTMWMLEFVENAG